MALRRLPAVRKLPQLLPPPKQCGKELSLDIVGMHCHRSLIYSLYALDGSTVLTSGMSHRTPTVWPHFERSGAC